MKFGSVLGFYIKEHCNNSSILKKSFCIPSLFERLAFKFGVLKINEIGGCALKIKHRIC